jgi:hypothetical protein
MWIPNRKIILLILLTFQFIIVVSQKILIERWRVTGAAKEIEDVFGQVTPASAKQYIEEKINEINVSKDSLNIFYQTEIISLCEEYLKKYTPDTESKDWKLFLHCAFIERDLTYTYYKRATLKFNGDDFRGAKDDLSKAVIIVRKSKPIGDEFLGSLLNFRGECHFNLNDKNLACKDWQEAVDLGNSTALEYVSKYCQY